MFDAADAAQKGYATFRGTHDVAKMPPHWRELEEWQRQAMVMVAAFAAMLATDKQ